MLKKKNKNSRLSLNSIIKSSSDSCQNLEK